MGNRIPSAEYPDGYLGTIQSRREDRLLDNLKSRQNQRAYQRGVHKGERIDPGDYFWPTEFQPDSGLRAEQRGVRQAPLGTIQEHLATQGRMLPRGARSLVAENFSALGGGDTRKMDQLRKQKPGWT